MVDSSDVASVASAAEDLASRISEKLLESEDGLSLLCARLQRSLEDCLAAWTVRQPCSFSAYADLWRNVRFQTEEISREDGLFAPGEAVRRSILSHAFPFSATGVSNEQPLVARVDAALSSETTLDVLSDMLERLFATYLQQVANKFDSANVLPLLRVAPLVQSESMSILSQLESNLYLENGILRNDTLLAYLQSCAGLNRSDQARKVLFICDENKRESVIASSLARIHASRTGLFMLDVFSSAATIQANSKAVDEGNFCSFVFSFVCEK
jgi:hypothetical protein